MKKDFLLKSESEWRELIKSSPIADWYKDNTSLEEILEVDFSPHVTYVYHIKLNNHKGHGLTVAVQSKNHLNRQYFKNYDEAAAVLSQIMLKK
jgi:hypothetical protein